MTPTPPDWLLARGGQLRPGLNGTKYLVYLEREPRYELTALPVQGQFGCRIIQTVNGKPIACQGLFATPEAALRGGLEALRLALGW